MPVQSAKAHSKKPSDVDLTVLCISVDEALVKEPPAFLLCGFKVSFGNISCAEVALYDSTAF